ncbi:ankyrin repeat domain-containing protein [Spirillospora sp. CA-255316]
MDQELADWRRIRRHAVPRWMIGRATERRLAGDRRGACAAAGVDVAFDVAGVARDHSPLLAELLADDLAHLVPDLLRWHLPRALHGRTTLATHRAVVLADYDLALKGEDVLNVCCGCPSHCLYVLTPTLVDGPQRLRLAFGTPPAALVSRTVRRTDWTRLRHLWDARHTAGLLAHAGGGERVPFFHPDGTPLTGHELPHADPGPDDPVRLTEWITLFQDEGRVEAAYAAAGFALDLSTEEIGVHGDPEDILRRLPAAPARVRAESAARGRGRNVPFLIPVPGRFPRCVRVQAAPDADGLTRLVVRVGLRKPREWADELPEAVWRRLPDLDLLRSGLIGPEELHPLVRSALFPARPAPAGPVGPPVPEGPRPVRVRCRGRWHEVRVRDGVLKGPHSDEEYARERAVRALGGEVAGCFAVQREWGERGGRLPKALRAQRETMFLCVQHGDAPGVLSLLDAGFDPHVRDGRGRTLLHHLHKVDHAELLPRLLAAGLDLEARDHQDRTPLHMAVGEHGSEDLVRALLDAGARIDTLDAREKSLRSLLRRRNAMRGPGRAELLFLAERIRREHPDGLGEMIMFDPQGRLH